MAAHKSLLFFFFIGTFMYSYSGSTDELQRQLTSSLDGIVKSASYSFMRNEGQWHDDVYFGGSAGGGLVYFLKNGLNFYASRELKSAGRKTGSDEDKRMIPVRESLQWYVSFKGMNANVIIEGKNSRKSKVNFFMGNDPSRYVTHASEYEMIQYKGLYNGIDALYFTQDQRLKYDFVVKPGADVGNIQLRFDGIDEIKIDEHGSLILKHAWGEVIESIPVSFQTTGGVRKEVPVVYKIINENTVGFRILEDYDRTSTLIIDPIVMEWGTFFNSTMIISIHDYCLNHCVDSVGNVYITGEATQGTIATVGAYQEAYGGAFASSDIILAKLLPDGSDVEFITFLGGSGGEEAWDVVVDGSGDAFLVGRSGSANFPTTAGTAISAVPLGGSDVVLSKVSSDGTALLYSTYIGGASIDWGQGLEVNAAEEIWITGKTHSAGFPTTAGAFDQLLGGSVDAFVLKMTIPSGIIYSTLLGGTGANTEWGKSLAVNNNGEVIVCGITTDADFPTTADALDAVHNGLEDVFITKLNNTGTSLLYSSFIGGAGDDRPFELKLNPAEEVIITGYTASANFPTSGSAYDKVLDGFSDAFVLKLDINNPALLFSTFLGGTNADEGHGLDMMDNGDIFVTGATGSIDFPTTSCAIMDTSGGLTDMFVSLLSENGDRLYFATYIGGTNNDYKEARVTVVGGDCNPSVVITGTTHSPDFPVTVGSFMDTKSNNVGDIHLAFKLKENYVAELDFSFSINQCTVSFIDSLDDICSFRPHPWSSLTDFWDFGDGDTSSTEDPVHTYDSSGTYTVMMVVGCNQDTVTKSVVVNCCEQALSTTVNALCAGSSGGSATVTGQGSGPWDYVWEDASSNVLLNQVDNPSASTNSSLSAGTYVVTITDANGCNSTETITITEPLALSLTAESVDATCGSADGIAAVMVTGGSPGYSYIWSFNGSTNDTLSNIGSGTYWVMVTDSNGCMDSVSIGVSDFPSAALVLSSDSAVCNGEASGSVVVTPTGTGPFTYNWSPSGGTDSTAISLLAGTYTVTVTDDNSCVTIESITVSEPAAISLVTASDSSHCGQNDGFAIVIASGGLGPGSPQWDDPLAQTTDTAINLPAGNYQVVVTDQNGCKDSTTVTITDIPGPTLSITSETDVLCNGDSSGTATVTASGSSLSYLWTPGGYISSNEINLAPNAYNVVVTDGNGCKDSLTITITEPTLLTGTITPTDASCGNSDGQATATPIGGTGPYTYAWDIDPAQASNFVDTLSVGPHTVTITDNNGCDTTYTFTIINPNAPTLNLSQTAQIQCYGDSNATAQANPAGGSGPYTYNWNTIPPQSGQTAIDLPPGQYTVTVTDDNNCQVQQTITITEPQELQSQITSTNATCDNNNGTATASANGGTGAITYQWNPSAGNIPDPTNLSPGIYTVTITDNNGCITTEAATIIMSTSNPTVTAWPDTTILTGSSVSVSASGGDTCLWMPSTGLSNPNSCNPTAAPNQTTTYIVEVTENGCKSTDTITIIVEEQNFALYIPNTFTPNGDEVNAWFDIRGVGISEYRLRIYDRWGEMIFESDNINTSWGGRAHGKKEVQQDVYVYELIVSDFTNQSYEYIGRVNVVR